MTAPDLVLFNTAEEILSSDLTTIGGLAGKAVQDALAMTEAGLYSTTNPRTCVREGLDAAPSIGLAVQITAGTCMAYDAAALAADASRYKLGRLTTSEVVAIAANGSPNGRVDLIYGTIGSADEASSTRLELVLPSRTINPVTVSKRRSPDLTLAVVTGTPSAVPAPPTVPAGVVPLWYVYVPSGATLIDQSWLIDARTPFYPASTSRAHTRIDGMFANGYVGTTQLWVGSGRCVVNGSPLEISQDRLFTGSQISPDGATALVASTEYFVYVIARGGSPVGKTVVDGYIPVLSTIVPTLDGRPSSPLTYRPLFNAAAPTTTINVQFATTDALHIGTVRTTIAAQFQDDSLPLNRTGLLNSALISIGQLGLPGRPNNFLVRPYFGWWDPAAVVIGECVVFMRGVPIRMLSNIATLPTDLVAGNVESPSTWYYVYLRNRVPQPTFPRTPYRELVQRISTQAPNSQGMKPTPESGFASDDYLYVGSFYNDAGSNIRKFVPVGDEIQWIGVTENLNILGIIAASPAFTDITNVVPSTATGTLVRLAGRMTGGTNVTGDVYAYPGIDGGSPLASMQVWAEASISPEIHQNVRIAISQTTKKFQMNRSTPGAPGTQVCVVFQYGYVETPIVPFNPLA